MANTDNLKPIRSVDEARAKGKKGGIASGKARREKKLFRELFTELLDEDGGTRNGEVITKRQVIAIKAMKFLTDDNDLDPKDFVKVMEFIRDTAGEKPTDKSIVSVQEASGKLNDIIEQLGGEELTE